MNDQHQPDPRQQQLQPPGYRPAPWPGQHVQPWQPQVAPKSVLGAVVISFFIPGAGAIYAGDRAWGFTILALWLVSIPLALVTVGILTGFICWVVGMISAASAAKKWNLAHGIIS